jgi:hypothetical protein
LSNHQATPQPPQPPEIRRRVAFHRTQLIGVPLLAIIPILALFGVFGTSTGEASAESAELQLHISYPTRFRYKVINSLTVEVRNRTGQALPAITVDFDKSYLSQFSGVAFTPSVKTVTGEVYMVELTDVQPNEARTVSVEIQAEEYGGHPGFISATAGDAEGVRATVNTFVFP